MVLPKDKCWLYKQKEFCKKTLTHEVLLFPNDKEKTKIYWDCIYGKKGRDTCDKWVDKK